MTRKILCILAAFFVFAAALPMSALALCAHASDRNVVSQVTITGYTVPEWGDNVAENRGAVTIANASLFDFECGWFTGTGSSLVEIGWDYSSNTYDESAVFDTAGTYYMMMNISLRNAGDAWADEETVISNLSVNGDYSYLDSFYWANNNRVLVLVLNPVTVTDPNAPQADALLSFCFEEEPVSEGWRFIDNDGDGYNWTWKYEEDPSYVYYAYEGQGNLRSDSWIYNIGNVTPDNWAVSPAFTVPENGALLTLYARCLENYPDTIGIYAGTSASVASMTAVRSEFALTGTYTQYSADLSSFAGQTVYIAIRHYGCTGEYYAVVDLIELWGEGDAPIVPEPVDPADNIITEVGVTGYVTPEVGNAPSFAIYPVSEANYYIPYDADEGVPGIQWFYNYYDEDGFGWEGYEVIEYGDTHNFDGHEKYFVQITLIAEDGYTFADLDGLTITINGEEALVSRADCYLSGGNTIITISSIETDLSGHTQPIDPGEPDPNAVTQVKIVGFTLPVQGNNPDNNLAVGGIAYCDVVTAQWRYIGANGEVPAGDFSQDGNYYQYIELTPIYNEFYFADEVTVTINGEAGYVASAVVDGRTLIVRTIEFTIGESPNQYIIDRIEISGFTAPVWGASTNVSGLSVPGDAHYAFYTLNTTWVALYGSDATILGSESVFDDEYAEYLLHIELFATGGYVFADEVTVTINGGTSVIYNHGFNADYNVYIVNTVRFTVESGEPAPIMGDANGDGSVDSMDALLVLRYSLGLTELSDEALTLCDVNSSGSVDSADALTILRFSMGVIAAL